MSNEIKDNRDFKSKKEAILSDKDITKIVSNMLLMRELIVDSITPYSADRESKDGETSEAPPPYETLLINWLNQNEKITPTAQTSQTEQTPQTENKSTKDTITTTREFSDNQQKLRTKQEFRDILHKFSSELKAILAPTVEATRLSIEEFDDIAHEFTPIQVDFWVNNKTLGAHILLAIISSELAKLKKQSQESGGESLHLRIQQLNKSKLTLENLTYQGEIAKMGAEIERILNAGEINPNILFDYIEHAKVLRKFYGQEYINAQQLENRDTEKENRLKALAFVCDDLVTYALPMCDALYYTNQPMPTEQLGRSDDRIGEYLHAVRTFLVPKESLLAAIPTEQIKPTGQNKPTQQYKLSQHNKPTQQNKSAQQDTKQAEPNPSLFIRFLKDNPDVAIFLKENLDKLKPIHEAYLKNKQKQKEQRDVRLARSELTRAIESIRALEALYKSVEEAHNLTYDVFKKKYKNYDRSKLIRQGWDLREKILTSKIELLNLLRQNLDQYSLQNLLLGNYSIIDVSSYRTPYYFDPFNAELDKNLNQLLELVKKNPAAEKQIENALAKKLQDSKNYKVELHEKYSYKESAKAKEAPKAQANKKTSSTPENTSEKKSDKSTSSTTESKAFSKQYKTWDELREALEPPKAQANKKTSSTPENTSENTSDKSTSSPTESKVDSKQSESSKNSESFRAVLRAVEERAAAEANARAEAVKRTAKALQTKAAKDAEIRARKADRKESKESIEHANQYQEFLSVVQNKQLGNVDQSHKDHTVSQQNKSTESPKLKENKSVKSNEGSQLKENKPASDAGKLSHPVTFTSTPASKGTVTSTPSSKGMVSSTPSSKATVTSTPSSKVTATSTITPSSKVTSATAKVTSAIAPSSKIASASTTTPSPKITPSATITSYKLVKNLINSLSEVKKEEEIPSLINRFKEEAKENQLSVTSIKQQLKTEVDLIRTLKEKGKQNMLPHLEALLADYNKLTLKPK